MSDNQTLGEALPKEIARVQSVVSMYLTVPMGHLAAMLMQRDIEAAQKAMIDGDLSGMIAAYQALKEWKDD